MRKVYGESTKFGDKSDGLPYRRYMREIDMGTDRDVFGDYDDGVPLYEGPMIGQYDHRAKAYRSGRGRASIWEELPFGREDKAIVPQWRVPWQALPDKVRQRVYQYRIGFCDVTSPTTDRSLVAALIPPRTLCGHTVPTFTFEAGEEWAYAAWLAVANSFVLDFIARKKISLHMSLGIVDSLPFPKFVRRHRALRSLVPLAAELTCVSQDMDDYWEMLYDGAWVGSRRPPRLLDERERLEMRAKIDVIVARDLFGLDASQMDSILSAFDLAARYEVERWGEFVSRRLIVDSLTRSGASASLAS